jgi:hypothetical protein
MNMKIINIIIRNINILLKYYMYNFIIIKDIGHYDYNSRRSNDYGMTITKNTTSGLCIESKCIIIMVVVNFIYDYKCNHICNHIFHILA